MTVAVRKVDAWTSDQCEDAWQKASETLNLEGQALEKILLKAFHHDTVCQEIYRSILVDFDAPTGHDVVDRVGYLSFAVINLCVEITKAAEGRVRELAWMADDIATGGALDLGDDALDQFMRPIFEASGIGDRLEVRTVFEKHPELVGRRKK